MKRVLVVLAVLAFSVSLFARVSKYKGWESSPEGYFMTNAERDQWSKINTDADAEKFIADFHARRRDGFEKEVADRAANADKYFTIGRTRGSKTMRGKVVILLGPPTSMDAASRAVGQSKRDNPSVAAGMANMNDGGGGMVGMKDVRTQEQDPGLTGSTMTTTQSVQMLHLNYQGAIAKTADRKQIDINIEVNPNTGTDLIASRTEAADVDSIFELIAQSWMRK